MYAVKSHKLASQHAGELCLTWLTFDTVVFYIHVIYIPGIMHTVLNFLWFGTHGVDACVQGPVSFPIRRLIVTSREVSKPRDWQLKLSQCFEIWQARRQHCCGSAYQISERKYNSEYKFRGVVTLHDITIGRLIKYWNWNMPWLLHGTTVNFWEWIRNFIPHFIGHVVTYPCWD